MVGSAALASGFLVGRVSGERPEIAAEAPQESDLVHLGSPNLQVILDKRSLVSSDSTIEDRSTLISPDCLGAVSRIGDAIYNAAESMDPLSFRNYLVTDLYDHVIGRYKDAAGAWISQFPEGERSVRSNQIYNYLRFETGFSPINPNDVDVDRNQFSVYATPNPGMVLAIPQSSRLSAMMNEDPNLAYTVEQYATNMMGSVAIMEGRYGEMGQARALDILR